MDYFKHILTGRGNKSWSATKLIAIVGTGALVVNFVTLQSDKYQELGIAVAALIAALAAKYHTEKEHDKVE